MKSSIFFTITLTFIFAIVSAILMFLWLIAYDQQNYTNELNSKYSLIANARMNLLNGYINEAEFNEQTKNYKMTLLIEPDEIRRVIFNGDILAKAITNTGQIEIIAYERENYLKIIHNGMLYLYNDQDYESYRYFYIKILATAIVLLYVALYLFIVRKLRPLTALKKEIDKFAKNKLDEVRDVGDGNDEISQVANAFFKAITQIKKLNKSRQFFIRNIMHELKTPITKGLIMLEMMKKNPYKERLISTFTRLETLINEFAAIEQISSGKAFLNRTKCNILDLIDEAKEIAMNDDSNVQIFVDKSFFVNVDFKLFAIAMKNMIDNGVKHSEDKFVQIYINDEFICFKNRGKKLGEKLEYYTQAFTQGGKRKDSFGLGLYIVNTILESHKMRLDYAYEESENLGENAGNLSENFGGNLDANLKPNLKPNGFNAFYFRDLKNILIN